MKGRWTYLHRAVDKQGRTVDFLLTAKRDVAAAKHFLSEGDERKRHTSVITLDRYAATHRAVRELKEEGRCRSECGSDRASISITESNKTTAE